MTIEKLLRKINTIFIKDRISGDLEYLDNNDYSHNSCFICGSWKGNIKICVVFNDTIYIVSVGVGHVEGGREITTMDYEGYDLEYENDTGLFRTEKPKELTSIDKELSA